MPFTYRFPYRCKIKLRRSCSLRPNVGTATAGVVTRLSKRDSRIVLQMLEDESEPNEALKAAAARFKRACV